MKEFIKKYKLQLIVTFYAAIAAAFFCFIVWPSVNKIADKASEIQQKRIDGELNEKRLALVPAMEENYNEFKNNENNLNIIIDSAKEVDFIKELEALADQTGNKIEFNVPDSADNSAAKPKSAEGDIKGKLAYTNYLSMQIALEGSYSSLLNFMHKLENYKNYVNIISISSEKKITVDSSLSANSNPFAAADQAAKKLLDKESINSILDVVVYNKPVPK